ncbi:MAG: hypothetical protein ACRDTS_08600, partial [Mycobacterium sp.]
MQPGLSFRLGRALVTVTAATAAAALATGCGGGQHDTTHGTTATVSPAAATVAGPELVRLWETHPLPCDHPIPISGPPHDAYNLLETAMWPNTADVASRLGAVTATGGQEFILSRLQFLDAVMLQTQSDIADQVATGTHEIDGVGGDPATETVIRNDSMRVIK